MAPQIVRSKVSRRQVSTKVSSAHAQVVNSHDIECSLRLLALLDVCQFAADHIESAGDNVFYLSGSIAHCIRLAEKLAHDNHAALERAKRHDAPYNSNTEATQ